MSFTSHMFYLNLTLLFIIFGVYSFPANEFEGSKCKNTDSNGICRLVDDCVVAIELLKKHRTIDLHRCGFQGVQEIVCCPDSVVRDSEPDTNWSGTTERTHSHVGNTDNRQKERKCEKVCNEIAKDANILPEFHILKGEPANPKEFPHMAALGFPLENGTIEYRCGATLISSRYLLTAAHCIINVAGDQPSQVRLGVTNINGNGGVAPRDYNIVDIKVHDKYNPRSKHNDIALLKVERDVKYDKTVYPACLYTKSNDPINLIVTGWGATNTNERQRSNVLLKKTYQPVPWKECNRAFNGVDKDIVDSQICAYINGSDTCKGDSGGPIQIQAIEDKVLYAVVGVTSYGINCGSTFPGIYTRVSYYLDWIENIVWS